MNYAVTYHLNSADYRAPDFKLTELRVESIPDRNKAQAYVDVWKTRHDPASHTESFGGFVASGPSDLDFGGPFLIRLHNTLATEMVDPTKTVNKFATKADAQRRTFALLQTKAGPPPAEEKEDGRGAPEASTETEAPNQPRTEPEGETEGSPQENEDMKTKKKAAKAAAKTKKAPAERKPRELVGKPAGKVADFRPVRDNTDRARVLKLMNGRHTATQIAHETGIEEKKIPTILFCLARDSGIGYDFGANGQIKAIFPGSNTLKDAIKSSTASED